MAAVNHKFNYFIYLTHTTNTTGFYYILRSYLIMEEYKTLSCVHGYHDYQRFWTVAVGVEFRFKMEMR